MKTFDATVIVLACLTFIVHGTALVLPVCTSSLRILRGYGNGVAVQNSVSTTRRLPTALQISSSEKIADGAVPLKNNNHVGKKKLTRASAWDLSYIFLRNVAQSCGFPSLDKAPVAKVGKYEGRRLKFLKCLLSGDLQELTGGPLFLKLNDYMHKYSPVFKLAFGPRSFIVISDPVMAKHVLKLNINCYDKGLLADTLGPIMGKGLIPAPPEIWKVRRPPIASALHKRWLDRMVRHVAECNIPLQTELGRAADQGQLVDMEEKFCSVSLDIIGRAVFNKDFNSTTTESPVVKAVYRILREAEHRSTSIIPYWKLPFKEKIMKSQAQFSADMKLLNSVLDELIDEAIKTQNTTDVEKLEQQNLDLVKDPSLLRFLIDMRGENATSIQLRDDLMTMLIAGHETTAAMLTWTLFHLSQLPLLTRDVRDEINSVLGSDDRLPTFDDLKKLNLTRFCLAESLRLYPEPPVLIRRTRTSITLPKGGAGVNKEAVYLSKGTDIFISTWNLHRSPYLWHEPLKYNPRRYLVDFDNPDVIGWDGFKSSKVSGLYPNEIASDFAFLPFGGGQRRCIGDQFAMMESLVTLVMLLRSYDFEMAIHPNEIGMKTGATIHTAKGLPVRVKRRKL